jgi:hypothetical protein
LPNPITLRYLTVHPQGIYPGTVIAKALEDFDGDQALISAMILNH